ncbi:MAG: methyltransferase domain-containing protein [Methylophaga sp.]|nr:methyltransferase domain-containing protein [Methylophaga sp.]
MVDYKTDSKQMMPDWWKSPLGQAVILQEKDKLQSLSHHFHGYYQLQLGNRRSLLPPTSRPSQQKIMANAADVEGHNEALPFKCHSLDLLLLNHVLEFSDDPHQVLREAERVLVADGTIVLCSFNPWSLWGLRCSLSWQDQPPWQGKFFRQARIKDWLALLNFEIIASEKILFSPPIRSSKWLNRFSFMERWGKRLWPFFAGATILIATKRTIPLTPVTQRWRARQLFPTGTFVSKPVTREKTNE